MTASQPVSDYAAQTHASKHWIVRYAHQRRFQLGLEVLQRRQVASVLDFGAGDGAFLLALERSRMADPLKLVAYNPAADKVANGAIRATVARADRSSVEIIDDLGDVASERFDAIVALSVLEHLTAPERTKFYSLCRDQLATGGLVLIEVPVEMGPSLLIKHWARTHLKGRDPEYSTRELLSLAIARTAFDPHRFDGTTSEQYIETHKGFDYRLLRHELSQHLEILNEFGSPLPRMPAWAGNQEVFFVARPRSAG